MSITVREAGYEDVRWIVRTLREGVDTGHFDKALANQADLMVNEIIREGKITWQKRRNYVHQPKIVSASIKVAEMNEQPASFLITLVDGDEVELYLIATRKQYRRRGCFSALVRNEISSWNDRVKIYARCYKKSTWAKCGLMKEGFVVSDQVEPVELMYERI